MRLCPFLTSRRYELGTGAVCRVVTQKASSHDGRDGCLDSRQNEELEVVSHAMDALVPKQTASVTRIMYNSLQNRAALSTATTGRHASGWRITGGLSSLLLVAVPIIAAFIAAMRARLKAVKECTACRGYGVQRCRLCGGKGTIDWEGKLAHREPCPMCLGRRLVKCDHCGGSPLIARGLFNHRSNKGEDALMAQLQNLATPSRERPRWARLISFGKGNRSDDDDDRIQQSDNLAEQIMMD